MSDESVVKPISDVNFDEGVQSGIVLIDFWAPWCSPCRLQGPILDRVAASAKPGVRIYKMNVDENPLVPQRFQISSIPTLLLFRNGELAESLVGLQDEKKLLALLGA